jgi:spermidine synthase
MLGRLVCKALVRHAPSILIGGLGMGYTLRAALDSLGPDARILVSELLPAVVEWNRGTLASLTSRPLDDHRVAVRSGSVVDVLAVHRHGFDAILLDVDNGPDAVLYEPNRFLYSAVGLELIASALATHGVLGVWSADRSPGFEHVLDAAGMTWRRVDVAVGRDGNGPEHTIYLARTDPDPPCAGW